eukprot:2881567-Rhodomonas_salina.1
MVRGPLGWVTPPPPESCSHSPSRHSHSLGSAARCVKDSVVPPVVHIVLLSGDSDACGAVGPFLTSNMNDPLPVLKVPGMGEAVVRNSAGQWC